MPSPKTLAPRGHPPRFGRGAVADESRGDFWASTPTTSGPRIQESGEVLAGPGCGPWVTGGGAWAWLFPWGWFCPVAVEIVKGW